MLIAQISDMHVNAPEAVGPAGTDAIAAMHQVVGFLNRMTPAPDVILATGDLAATFGRAKEYSALHEALSALTSPVFLIPGNHDNRDQIRKFFPDHTYLPAKGFLHYVVDDYPVRLIGLDTQVPGAPGGIMDEERLEWLDCRLTEAPERPTVLFMHHHPFRTGIRRMDGMMCENGDAMAAVVQRHRQVLRVLCGHVHRPIQRLWAGTLAMIAPSSLVQLSLVLDPEGPLNYIHEPPAILLHHWDGDGMNSHVVTVGDHEQSPP